MRIPGADDTWARLKSGSKTRWRHWRSQWSEQDKSWWQRWRAARSERDMLAQYRAGYGKETRFRWWQRMRAGVGLFFVVVLMGAGLTMLVGLFFVGLTIALETLV